MTAASSAAAKRRERRKVKVERERIGLRKPIGEWRLRERERFEDGVEVKVVVRKLVGRAEE